jgi:hypothetical protein
MDKETKDGYVAGLVCLLVFAVLAYYTIMSASNASSAVITGIFAAFFGGLGFGSLAKPNTVGAIVSQFFRNFEGEKEGSDSHNKQVQKETSGSVQVMGDQAQININVPPREKEQAQKSLTKEREFRKKEKIVIGPKEGCYYDFELSKGNHVKGEISSSSPIDICFLDSVNFDKWDRERRFEYEDSNEGILETIIDYVVPTKGTWYVAIDNNGRKSATVEVHLH